MKTSLLLPVLLMTIAPEVARATLTKARTGPVGSVPISILTTCQITGPATVAVVTSIMDGKPFSTGTINAFYLTITTPALINSGTLSALYYYADYTNTVLTAPPLPAPPPPPKPTPTPKPSPTPSGSPGSGGPSSTPDPTFGYTPPVPDVPPFSLAPDGNTVDVPIPQFNGPSVSVYIPGWPVGVGQALYTAKLDGPGGYGTCQFLVRAVCQYQPFHCNLETNGTTVANGACWAPVNNPPYCDWWLYGPSGVVLRGPTDGCFPGETKIRLANGRDKQAFYVEAGDILWNPVRRKGMKVKSTTVGPESHRLLDLGYEDHGRAVHVQVTTKHPMVTPQGPRQAETLTNEDLILGADGRFHRLTHIVRLPLQKEQVVFNFTLDTDSSLPEDHMIQADGIVTGDLYLQKRLGKSLP